MENIDLPQSGDFVAAFGCEVLFEDDISYVCVFNNNSERLEVGVNFGERDVSMRLFLSEKMMFDVVVGNVLSVSLFEKRGSIVVKTIGGHIEISIEGYPKIRIVELNRQELF